MLDELLVIIRIYRINLKLLRIEGLYISNK